MNKARAAARTARHRAHARLTKSGDWAALSPEQRHERERAMLTVINDKLVAKELEIRRQWNVLQIQEDNTADNMSNLRNGNKDNLDTEESDGEAVATDSIDTSENGLDDTMESDGESVVTDSMDVSEDGLNEDEWVDSDGNEISKQGVNESLAEVLREHRDAWFTGLDYIERKGSLEELPLSETDDEDDL